jgi:hypothetical protein
MFLAWSIALTIYCRKRYRRRERRRLVAVGKATPKKTDLDIPQENVIILPDPAVLLGQCKPGEVIIPESRNTRYIFGLPLPWSRHGSRQQKGHDKAIVTENTPFPVNAHAVHDTAVEAKEEDDAIVDEMTVPMKV